MTKESFLKAQQILSDINALESEKHRIAKLTPTPQTCAVTNNTSDFLIELYESTKELAISKIDTIINTLQIEFNKL